MGQIYLRTILCKRVVSMFDAKCERLICYFLGACVEQTSVVKCFNFCVAIVEESTSYIEQIDGTRRR